MSNINLSKLLRIRDGASFADGSETETAPADPTVAAESLTPEEVRVLSEHRMLRITATNDLDQEAEPEVINEDTLRSFISEELPPNEMQRLQELIRKDPAAKTAYLESRLRYTNSLTPSLPEELKNRGLEAFLEPMRTIDQQTPSSRRVEGFRSRLSNLFSPLNIAVAGGVVAAVFLGFIGLQQFGPLGPEKVQPIIVARLVTNLPADTQLQFRSAKSNQTAPSPDQRLATAIMTPGLSAAILEFGNRANKNTLSGLKKAINSVAQTLNLDQVEAVRIHPKLWGDVRGSTATGKPVKIQVLETIDQTAPLKIKGDPEKITIIYLANES